MSDVLPVGDVVDAHVLLYLGDSVSTDQISLAGSIAKNTPAARYLSSKGYAIFVFCLPGKYTSIHNHSHFMALLDFVLVSRHQKGKTRKLKPIWI